ncbi:MAG: cupin domain-containing protein [Roseibium sp.]|uniref:cupin domain-containing protein n=1 Tax=Roseibium sp. TaxID=1936156 RepID=UPI00261E30E6|nr:cupin domain-containing protein [Roseibium sp.]MCV0427161.1 cupin domain-containing protein [Roseibium sp.]
MPELNMSLVHDTLGPGEFLHLSAPYTAVWPLKVEASYNGCKLSAQTGYLLDRSGSLGAACETVDLIRFTVGQSPVPLAERSCVLMSETVEVHSPVMLLRLDKVSFPPGASAWRHVHPGPGFRYLLKGQLRLQPDDHAKTVQAGDSWFEAENTPVKATAGNSFAESAFIRLMLLPLKYKGKSTINVLSEEDRLRERRQTTTTYFDVPVDF